VSERRTLCDLGMVTVDFGRTDAKTPDPGNTFPAYLSKEQEVFPPAESRPSVGAQAVRHSRR